MLKLHQVIADNRPRAFSTQGSLQVVGKVGRHVRTPVMQAGGSAIFWIANFTKHDAEHRDA